MPKDASNWCFSTTTLGHLLQKLSKCLKALQRHPLPAIFARHFFFRLSCVLVDDWWSSRAAFHFLWISQKMGLFLDTLKRWKISPTRSTFAAERWGKIVSDDVEFLERNALHHIFIRIKLQSSKKKHPKLFYTQNGWRLETGKESSLCEKNDKIFVLLLIL